MYAILWLVLAASQNSLAIDEQQVGREQLAQIATLQQTNEQQRQDTRTGIFQLARQFARAGTFSTTETELRQRRWLRLMLAHQQRTFQSLVQEQRDLNKLEAAFVARQQTLASMQITRKPKPQSFVSQRGTLAWPTSGAIVDAFGKKGVLIKAPKGAVINAVADGTVAYADDLKGYGKLIIVDHGNDYHSVLAHLGKLTVAHGDKVQLGQALGTIEPANDKLYFEIRHNSVPLDPKAWLKKP
jgi:murein hydrolase activator